MEPFSPDLAALVPHWSWNTAADFLFECLFQVALPGWLLSIVFRIRSGCRAERWATIGLLGMLFSCLHHWVVLVAFEPDSVPLLLQAETKPALVMIAIVLLVALDKTRVRGCRALKRPGRGFRPYSLWESMGYVMIAALVAYYLLRTAPLFDFDGSRLRLYGAAFTDKLTNMMSCAALEHGAPPDCLRFAGRKFPSHYFPHLFTAMLGGRADDGVPYFSGFWFFVPTLGIVVNGLAILAFGRRVLKSSAAGWMALLVYGLTSVTPGLKPLDITPAAALLGLLALDRFRHSGRKRWAGLGITLLGTMPCFETFHAFLMLAAVGLWGGTHFLLDLSTRRRQSSAAIRWSYCVIPAGVALVAYGSLQLLYLGERAVAPPRIVVSNVFGNSYRNTWEALAADDDTVGRAVAMLDRWKRKPQSSGNSSGKSSGKSNASANAAESPVADIPVAWYERTFAKLIYTLGIPIYVFCRFVHLALFGIVYLWRKRSVGPWRKRGGSLRPSEQIIAAAALIGFVAPWIVDVGIMAGGQWWSSPNLYRPTEFGSWLLATLGAGEVVRCGRDLIARRFRRAWPLAVVAGYWLVTVTSEHLAPTTTYLEVPHDQLAALAYMRQKIAYGDVVVHPWSDCEIRDAARGDALSFVYKRHFTLGSNLAGRTMYYEGREDYTFSNGFIAPEDVYRRSRARKKFYTEPDAATLAEVLEAVPVRYVVEDENRPAPNALRDAWPVVFESGQIKIRRRP